MSYIQPQGLAPEAQNPVTVSNPKKIYHDFTMEDAEVIGGLCRLQDCVRPTSPRSQMEREKRIRREIANSNERRRMQSINTGFQALKSLIPHTDGEKLSKAAILQQTSEYILQLEKEKAKLHHQNALLLRKLGGVQQQQPTQPSQAPQQNQQQQQHHPQQPQPQQQWESDGSDRAPSPPPKWRKVGAVGETSEVQDSSDEGVGGLTPEANNQRVPSAQAVTPEFLQQQSAQIESMKRDINELTKLLDCERSASKTLRQLLEDRVRETHQAKGVNVIDPAVVKPSHINNNNNVAVVSAAPSIVFSGPSLAPASVAKPTSFGGLSTPRPIKPQIVTIPQPPAKAMPMIAPLAPAPKAPHRINTASVKQPVNSAPIAVALKQPLDVSGKGLVMTSPPPPTPPVSGNLPVPVGISPQGGAVQFVASQSGGNQGATHMIIPISLANMTTQLQQISPAASGNTTVFLANQLPQLTAATPSGLKVEVKQEPPPSILTSTDAATALLRHQIQQQQLPAVASSALLSPTNTVSLSQQVNNNGGVAAAILPASGSAGNNTTLLLQATQAALDRLSGQPSSLLSPMNQAINSSSILNGGTSSGGALPRVVALPVQSANPNPLPVVSYGSNVGEGTVELLLSPSGNHLLQQHHQKSPVQQLQHHIKAHPHIQVQAAAGNPLGSHFVNSSAQVVEASSNDGLQVNQPHQIMRQNLSPLPLPPHGQGLPSPTARHHGSLSPQVAAAAAAAAAATSASLAPLASAMSPSQAMTEEPGHHKVSSGLETIFEAIHHVEGTACQGCHMHGEDQIHAHTHSPVCAELAAKTHSQRPSAARQPYQSEYLPAPPSPQQPPHILSPTSKPAEDSKLDSFFASRKRGRDLDDEDEASRHAAKFSVVSSIREPVSTLSLQSTKHGESRNQTSAQQHPQQPLFPKQQSNVSSAAPPTTTVSPSSVVSSHQKALLRHPKKDMRARTLILDQDGP